MKIFALLLLVISFSSQAANTVLTCATPKGDLITVSSTKDDYVFYLKLNGEIKNTVSPQNIAEGKMLLGKDGYSVFEWQTYVEKNTKGEWHLNRYWFCDSTYFEEKCAVDELRLEQSTKLNCIE